MILPGIVIMRRLCESSFEAASLVIPVVFKCCRRPGVVGMLNTLAKMSQELVVTRSWDALNLIHVEIPLTCLHTRLKYQTTLTLTSSWNLRHMQTSLENGISSSALRCVRAILSLSVRYLEIKNFLAPTNVLLEFSYIGIVEKSTVNPSVKGGQIKEMLPVDSALAGKNSGLPA